MITVTFRPLQIHSLHSPEQNEYMLFNWRLSGHSHIWRPPTDLLELEDNFLVRVEIAGMDEKDFEISLDQSLLTIHGVRYDIPDRRAYHQMEVNIGEFFTVIEIPGPIDAERVSAEYQKGFLWVTLPKSEPKQIHINE